MRTLDGMRVASHAIARTPIDCGEVAVAARHVSLQQTTLSMRRLASCVAGW
jgi:hypothetical protein